MYYELYLIYKKKINKLSIMAYNKYVINEDHSDNKYRLKEIQPGLFSSKPELLHIINNKAYANLVVIPEYDDIYGIYFTKQPGETQLKNKFDVVGSIFMDDYIKCSKFLIHKLRKYKKIIDGERYFTTKDPDELMDKCREIVETFNKNQETKKDAHSLYI